MVTMYYSLKILVFWFGIGVVCQVVSFFPVSEWVNGVLSIGGLVMAVLYYRNLDKSKPVTTSRAVTAIAASIVGFILFALVYEIFQAAIGGSLSFIFNHIAMSIWLLSIPKLTVIVRDNAFIKKYI
ncbi:hypothetical protein [Aliivibrio fischeri]|uniref:hypothetical protein n=1 Tax=Aliivibrio fischeri TaxID=668 RepID=UPI001669A70A|nr:hypothetical protein [Aliivibrio fischeri]USR98098.1 hypothetical protein AVFI_16715 [Aliivibrio fischeri ATCC 7744 = JCM 18803 = DSM 507]GGK37074.1 hypothetical protein GCM10007987_20530 [Aliivibrio fischeri]